MAIINNFSNDNPPNGNSPTNGSSATKPTTFKIGDKSYKIQDLIDFDLKNSNHFYNYARDFAGFTSEDDSTALRGAINDAINHAVEGGSFDANYSHGDVKNHMTEGGIEQGLVGPGSMLSRFMYGFTKNATPVEEEKKIWNQEKHGFQNQINYSGYTAQGIFSDYDNGSSGQRSNSERYGILKSILGDYLKNINGYDPTTDNNEFNDNYIKTAQNLQTLLNGINVNNKDVERLLRALNVNDDFITAFTSTDERIFANEKEKENYYKEKEGKEKQQQEEQAKEERRKNFNNWFKEALAMKAETYSFGVPEFKKIEITNDDFLKSYKNSVIINGNSEYGTVMQSDADWDTQWDKLISNLKRREKLDANSGVLLQGALELQNKLGEEKFKKLEKIDNNEYLIKDAIDNIIGWVYNPAYNEIYPVNITNYSNNEWVKNKIIEIFDKQNKGNINYATDVFGLKNGGFIKKYDDGGYFDWDAYSQLMNQSSNEVNERQEIDEKQEELEKREDARNRPVSTNAFKGANKTIANPDAGFTSAEYARLAGIGLDLASMFGGVTVGTAFGVGSTALNLFADIKDDGFQFKDLGNAAVNLGFDLLGAIPVFGSAVGTIPKMVRNLVKYGPKVMTFLAGLGGVANIGGMTESWEKLLSTEDGKKLTVQDWRNIAQSIQLLTGGVRGARNIKSQNKIRNKVVEDAKRNHTIGVQVRDKNNKVEQYLFDSEIGEKIVNAKGDISTIDNIIKETLGNDYSVVTRNTGTNVQWFKNTDTNADATTTNFKLVSIKPEERAAVDYIYDFDGFGNKSLVRRANKYNSTQKGYNDRRRRNNNESNEPNATPSSRTESIDTPTSTPASNTTPTPSRQSTPRAPRAPKGANEIRKYLDKATDEQIVEIANKTGSNLSMDQGNAAIKKARESLKGLLHDEAQFNKIKRVIEENPQPTSTLSSNQTNTNTTVNQTNNSNSFDREPSPRVLEKLRNFSSDNIPKGTQHSRQEAETKYLGYQQSIKKSTDEITQIENKLSGYKHKFRNKSKEELSERIQELAAEEKNFNQQINSLPKSKTTVNTKRKRRESNKLKELKQRYQNKLDKVIKEKNELIGIRQLKEDKEKIDLDLGNLRKQISEMTKEEGNPYAFSIKDLDGKRVYITNYYKLGGVIDRKKLIKYLNYAQR